MNDNTANFSMVRKLSSDNFINIVLINQIPGSVMYNISLTDKGKQYVINVEKKPDGFIPILLGERKLVKITGMKITNDNKKADVEFEWNVVNLSPFGKIIQNQSDRFGGDLIQEEMPIESNGKTYRGTASISLYDDGWRIDKGSMNIGNIRNFGF
jgi:hypothetical protein